MHDKPMSDDLTAGLFGLAIDGSYGELQKRMAAVGDQATLDTVVSNAVGVTRHLVLDDVGKAPDADTLRKVADTVVDSEPGIVWTVSEVHRYLDTVVFGEADVDTVFEGSDRTQLPVIVAARLLHVSHGADWRAQLVTLRSRPASQGLTPAG